MYSRILQKVIHALESLGVQDTLKVVVEPTKDSAHGDMATNAAMVCAKALGLAPKDLASKLVQKLSTDNDFDHIEIAGPGFINMTLKTNLWLEELKAIQKPDYGASTIGKGKTVNVEFVSANPTGPMHTGHARNAVLGDAIASLLQKTGYTVIREYYINDAGGQVKTLAESVYLRYLEACNEPIHENAYEGKYPGDYLIPVGQALFAKYQKQFVGISGWEEIFQETAISTMMEKIREDLKRIGVEMDIYTSEKSLAHTIDDVLLALKDDIYTGVLEKPKGHLDDWEERPQTLFKATKYGDDTDRALKKSNGSWTYFAGDIAYHLHKLNRHYDKMINIFGADHIGYITRLKAAVAALSQNTADFEIKASQLVNFLDNGVQVKMSKRAGTFITIEDVVERVGKDATRFMMVSRHQDMPIDFDFAKVLEQSKDNPLFYIQYAHARIHSVLRLANLESIDNPDLSYLSDPFELGLIKKLCQLPRQIDIAAKSLEPHRICAYLYDVAALFHGLWNMGKENRTLRFIDEENIESTKARLFLITGVASILSTGLELLGITPLKEMR